MIMLFAERKLVLRSHLLCDVVKEYWGEKGGVRFDRGGWLRACTNHKTISPGGPWQMIDGETWSRWAFKSSVTHGSTAKTLVCSV